ncbi:hypothetical protein LRR80_05421 [Streptomyces sp. RO-S4]|uniref:hypothetical protein n=1 Tax=Streptomyces sp. RO-S4 TaxID=2902486 RepID=UPI00208F24E1|nr:hypothetical protein [Streptomyces sp. RO-S4]MCO4699327.1 hypothetical protein [Streptomyces sp. RO-S4]
MNPADELRTAAARLRELAARAMHEDRPHWNTGHTLGSRSPVVVDHPETPSVLIETYAARLEAVNRYIAAMDPALGMVLAGWLDQAARYYEAGVQAADDVFRDDPAGREAFLTTGPGAPSEHALAVARQINGKDQAA